MGTKHDEQKLRYDLIDPIFEQELAAALTYGVIKYTEQSFETANWKTLSNGKMRYYGALRRHLNAWRQGEAIDKESNLPHLNLVISNLMFLSWFDRNK